MDILKSKGGHTQGGSKHIKQPTTGQERTQGQPFAPFLFVCTSEREKETTKTKQERKGTKSIKAATKAKQAKSIKEEQTQRQKEKKERQTRHKPRNRLTTHAHKSPTSHAKHASNTNPHETPKPAKNALKTRNKGIFKYNAPKTKR